MTLEELGKQYADELKTVEKQLQQAKKALKQAKTEDEIFRIKHKIHVYEEMCADLKSYSEHLKHYYEER